MELLERDAYMETLNGLFEKIAQHKGHTVFLSGEGGLGKSSLIYSFLGGLDRSVKVLKGGCDSLFTPRPLGPLYDLAPDLSMRFNDYLMEESNKALLFSAFLQELKSMGRNMVLIIEDIHWADEASMDLLKFLCRRIHTINCLLIISFRENEIIHKHLFRTIYGEVPPDHYTKLKLKPLSLGAVKTLAAETRHDYKHVYRLTKGNPFYVTELLAHYDEGIPENIKDAILNVFLKQSETVRRLWEIISIFPGRVNITLIEKLEPDFYDSVESCLASGTLIIKDNFLFFKHELYRTAIEGELSAIKKKRLNQKVLNYLLTKKVEPKNLSLVVHFAKNSQNGELVEKYAPIAGDRAAIQGSHIEACKLFLTAIEYKNDQGEELAILYEKAAYECYLTNQTRKAIEEQTKALEIWRELGNNLKIVFSLRFLSRLNWFEGKKREAEYFGLEAINAVEALKGGEPKFIKEKALVYSNYSQLKMLSYENKLCLEYGNKAIALAEEINDEEILSHAYNNIGTSLYLEDKVGLDYLKKSLTIALNNKYNEHVARAYTNIISISVENKDYQITRNHIADALEYCDENDLHSWSYYMLTWKARYHFEQCEWGDVEDITRGILKNQHHPPIIRIGALTILGRLLNRKESAAGLEYLLESMDLALNAGEIQRIHPLTIAILEYEWMTGDSEYTDELLEELFGLLKKIPSKIHFDELVRWLKRTNRPYDHLLKWFPVYTVDMINTRREAERFKNLGCQFEYALGIYALSKEDSYEAVRIMDGLNLSEVCNFLKNDLRFKGIKSVPRGYRDSTKSNPAFLTKRQLDVLGFLKHGCTNQEIADKLFISPKTVDHHVSAILSKLEVNTRQKAVNEAEKMGIIN
ncbi:AAA family ATPase [Flagellimonas sp. GZD32]|uniref:helix-turn-helix transcriptional regulator n=1 Tax=Flagellimonas cixiensis TaxID=3228750 RepID=UPI0035C8E717